MVMTASTMLTLGTRAPDFRLPDVDGKIVSATDFVDAKALLVVFMCNHCPFVKHIVDEFVTLAGEYLAKGLAVVAINSNDVQTYAEDRPEMMKKIVAQKGFGFPYLYDQTQEVAKAYRAACTPDFFLFDRSRKLVYRGQMDGSRPGNDVPITGADLRAALDAVLADEPVRDRQQPSIGCNIKWKAGNEPDYSG